MAGDIHLSCSLDGVHPASRIACFHLDTLRVAESVPHLGLPILAGPGRPDSGHPGPHLGDIAPGQNLESSMSYEPEPYESTGPCRWELRKHRELGKGFPGPPTKALQAVCRLKVLAALRTKVKIINLLLRIGERIGPTNPIS